ncbi:MAG: endo-1,4-beta-xylanase [Planctomycetaceae bacterium]|nr:endo-1,4-beta-xylanase [Planctomycetaceae bacterium]
MIRRAGILVAAFVAAGYAAPNEGSVSPITLRAAAERRGLLVGAATMSGTLKDLRHAETLAREFNLVTPENEMKWAFIRPTRQTWNFAGADRLVAFAEKHKLAIHGHNLLWYAHNPPWLTAMPWTPAQTQQLMTEHIGTVVGRYRGKIAIWDVVNEEINEQGLLRKSLWSRAGTNYLSLAFRTAHEADPKAHLVYNDYGIEEVNRKSDGAYALLKSLKAQGAPVHGVGFQCHVEGNGPDLESFARNLQRFADLGLDLHLTEIDVRIKVPATPQDYARQARVYRGLIATALKNPRTKSVTTWGHSDAHSWVPSFFKGFGDALPFDARYQPKPAYEAMRQAMMESAPRH